MSINHVPFVTLGLNLLSEMICLCTVNISELGFAHRLQVRSDCLMGGGGAVADSYLLF